MSRRFLGGVCILFNRWWAEAKVGEKRVGCSLLGVLRRGGGWGKEKDGRSQGNVKAKQRQSQGKVKENTRVEKHEREAAGFGLSLIRDLIVCFYFHVNRELASSYPIIETGLSRT